MKKPITVGVSARHVHLSEEHLEILFGVGHKLTNSKELSQPGQFACDERVDIWSLDPKGKVLSGVRILGPTRKATQVELVRSDCIRNKIAAPVRESGDLAGSGSCKIVGPVGEVIIPEGVIVASRHIHFSEEEAAEYGVVDGKIVSVKIPGLRGGVLGNVLCRVSPNYRLDFHIDTDEACGMDIDCGLEVELINE